ncbi:MAG: proteasome ATPase, partial [Acidimicrobiales bacterium]|nr:proteasome ATPase [Acidimicrobiales bacterium]
MSDDAERRAAEQAAELDELREQAAALEDEVVGLRRRLQDAPKRVRTLEERLLETKGQLAQAVTQNEKLTYTLREAREHIAALREEVDKLTQPPAAYGTVLGINEDDETVDVFSGGRKMRVAAMPEVLGTLRRGDEVALNESFSVILSRQSERTGEVVTVKDVMGAGRVLIVGRADEERVCELLEEVAEVGIRVGDTVLMDPRSGLVVEKLARPEVEELVLEEVPDIS